VGQRPNHATPALAAGVTIPGGLAIALGKPGESGYARSEYAAPDAGELALVADQSKRAGWEVPPEGSKWHSHLVVAHVTNRYPHEVTAHARLVELTHTTMLGTTFPLTWYGAADRQTIPPGATDYVIIHRSFSYGELHMDARPWFSFMRGSMMALEVWCDEPKSLTRVCFRFERSSPTQMWPDVVTLDCAESRGGSATPPSRLPLFRVRDKGTRLASERLRADESYTGQIADVSGGAQASFSDTIATGLMYTDPPNPPRRYDDPAELADMAHRLESELLDSEPDPGEYKVAFQHRVRGFQRQLWENGYFHPRLEAVANEDNLNGGGIAAIRHYLDEIWEHLVQEPENKDMSQPK
jgi:hypothetical protein